MALITAALTALALSGEPDTTSGYVSKYADGVFERTIQARIELGYGTVPADWRDFDGFFAGLDCAAALAGTTLYARPGAGYPFEKLLYSDCSGHASTTEHFLRDNILGEVDWYTFERWHAAGYHTERGMTIEIVSPEWFYGQL